MLLKVHKNYPSRKTAVSDKRQRMETIRKYVQQDRTQRHDYQPQWTLATVPFHQLLPPGRNIYQSGQMYRETTNYSSATPR